MSDNELRVPHVGSMVIFSYGDPREIRGQVIDLPMVVVAIEGTNVAGQAFLYPGTVVDTPQGRMPVGLMPVPGVPYSDKPKAMTWRWPNDAVALPAAPKSALVGL